MIKVIQSAICSPNHHPTLTILGALQSPENSLSDSTKIIYPTDQKLLSKITKKGNFQIARDKKVPMIKVIQSAICSPNHHPTLTILVAL
jgi:hypothetical protein